MRNTLPITLVRFVVGLVFVTEGLLKFLNPAELGAGRFAAIGLPFPHLLGPLVGAVEIAGGIAVAFNLLAGDAAVALIAVILTALVTTKVPVLLGHPLGPFSLIKLPRYGLLSFLHEARLDLAMLFALLAVAIDSGVRVGQRRRWYQPRGARP